jgi:hypothetical protein
MELLEVIVGGHQYARCGWKWNSCFLGFELDRFIGVIMCWLDRSRGPRAVIPTRFLRTCTNAGEISRLMNQSPGNFVDQSLFQGIFKLFGSQASMILLRQFLASKFFSISRYLSSAMGSVPELPGLAGANTDLKVCANTLLSLLAIFKLVEPIGQIWNAPSCGKQHHPPCSQPSHKPRGRPKGLGHRVCTREWFIGDGLPQELAQGFPPFLHFHHEELLFGYKALHPLVVSCEDIY